MTVLTVLEIIRLSMEITLEAMKSIPEADRREAWERHMKRIEFWESLAEKIKDKVAQ